MTLRWITFLTVLIGVVQPGLAQTVTHHSSKPTHHPHAKHAPAKHNQSHKLKYRPTKSKHTTTDSADAGLGENEQSFIAEKTSIKPIAAVVPQPQFDTNYSIDTQAADLQSSPADTMETADTSSVDTSQQALTALAYKTVETQRYSTYKLGGTTFDTAQGIYKIDCSTYVNDLLSQANPQAFTSLANRTQTDRPTSHDYYKFIKSLPEDASTPYWRKINSIGELQPGGVLVFLKQYLRRHHTYAGGGHVMLVMSKPVPHPYFADTFQIKVADSASSGHSDDTRLPHRSGIGIGTMLLKVDHFTGQPLAYAWKLNDRLRGHTLFAMAQPVSQS